MVWTLDGDLQLSCALAASCAVQLQKVCHTGPHPNPYPQSLLKHMFGEWWGWGVTVCCERGICQVYLTFRRSVGWDSGIGPP